MGKIVLLLLLLFLASCDQIKQYQESAAEKRFGKVKTQSELPQWQKAVLEYEKEIEKKIAAGGNSGRLHRKIGESFAQMESFQLCSDHLKKAIDFGYADADIFYSLGLCQGSLARIHNWPYELTKQAEESFLKALNLDKSYSRAVFQLGLIYFYGFSRHNKYQILGEEITVKEQKFREKAIELMLKYQSLELNDDKSYFALAQMFIITGKADRAHEQYLRLTNLLKKMFPKDYEKHPQYIKASENLKQLSKTK